MNVVKKKKNRTEHLSKHMGTPILRAMDLVVSILMVGHQISPSDLTMGGHGAQVVTADADVISF